MANISTTRGKEAAIHDRLKDVFNSGPAARVRGEYLSQQPFKSLEGLSARPIRAFEAIPYQDLDGKSEDARNAMRSAVAEAVMSRALRQLLSLPELGPKITKDNVQEREVISVEWDVRNMPTSGRLLGRPGDTVITVIVDDPLGPTGTPTTAPSATPTPSVDVDKITKDAKAAAVGEVLSLMDEVEANLLPNADPAFVVLLLRDKIGGLT